MTQLKVHLRGDPETLGELQNRGFLSEPIISPQNPLTARVIVNRVWRWHFWCLVETDNFGVLGATPSHPELLDWLASWFMEQGWSMKSLHRIILSSATWQASSKKPLESKDPQNRLFSRFPIRKLSAEEIRDTWISLSGGFEPFCRRKNLFLKIESTFSL